MSNDVSMTIATVTPEYKRTHRGASKDFKGATGP